MTGNISLTGSEQPINLTIQTERLKPFKHFPQPIFLFQPNLELIESNLQGEKAIEKHWVGLRGNKLHFNCRKNNAHVNRVIEQLCVDIECESETQNFNHSERFVLRNIDMVYRAYTLSRESRYSDNLILSIQGDITYSERKIKTLARAFGLSSSETRIVNMMVAGKKPKEIAYEAGISLNTVRTHLRTLYAKMQVRDYNEALTQAVRLLV